MIRDLKIVSIVRGIEHNVSGIWYHLQGGHEKSLTKLY